MKDNGYKLIGTLNLFNTEVPCFVYCVFEKDGLYYLEHSDFNLEKIDCFVALQPSIFPNSKFFKINPLILNTSTFNIKDSYNVGDNCILAFKQNEKNIVIGDLPWMVKFLKQYINRKKIDNIHVINEMDSIIKKFENPMKLTDEQIEAQQIFVEHLEVKNAKTRKRS